MPRTLLAVVLALTACGGARPPREAEQPTNSSARVSVSLRDAGEVVRLAVGQRLVVVPGRGAGESRWMVARWPQVALERSGGRRVASRHVFEAVAEGRGDVLLVNLAAWPRGPCDPTSSSARRCVRLLAGWEPAGSEPANLRTLGFQVVVS
jgi:hypothetical protein